MKTIFYITTLSFGLISCVNNSSNTIITASRAVQLDTASAECPYLTKDATGNTILSWIRMVNDTTTAFCYARSNDGKNFSVPVVIPNSNNIQPHGENLPKIIVRPSGEIIAMWGEANPNPANKYSGLVFYTQSFDDGKSWTTAKPLVSDTASYDQRYFYLAVLPNGEAGVIWLDNRKTISKDGSGLYFASTVGNNGFGNEKLISQPCCQCCRTDLFVDKKGGIHTLFRGIVQDSIRDMVHIFSSDGGTTFSNPKRISEDNWVINGCPHTGPAMTENAEGIHFAWFTGKNRKGCYYTKSTDNGKTFKQRDMISSFGSHPQLASMSNGNILVTWDETHVVENKTQKQIGIQKRNAEGKTEGTAIISSADSQAAFPVIAVTGDQSAIVAYSIKKGERNFVVYQVIDLK